jgi:hypothetical protein
MSAVTSQSQSRPVVIERKQQSMTVFDDEREAWELDLLTAMTAQAAVSLLGMR